MFCWLPSRWYIVVFNLLIFRGTPLVPSSVYTENKSISAFASIYSFKCLHSPRIFFGVFFLFFLACFVQRTKALKLTHPLFSKYTFPTFFSTFKKKCTFYLDHSHLHWFTVSFISYISDMWWIELKNASSPRNSVCTLQW